MTNGRIGGDRKSAQAKATRANLVTEIAEHRQQLDAYISQLRQQHGNAAIDEALERLRQRDKITIAPRTK